MNEVLLAELNAYAHAALELLAAGNVDGCRTALKVIADEIDSQLEENDN
jgi:hypothetical protein